MHGREMGSFLLDDQKTGESYGAANHTVYDEDQEAEFPKMETIAQFGKNATTIY